MQTDRGFSLVELMIAVAIIGLLAAIATTAYLRFMKKARTAEVPGNVKKMFDGAKVYFEAGVRVKRGSFKNVKKSFRKHAFPNTTKLTPKKRCCKQSGSKCRNTDWENPSWKALGFEIADPHRFQYRFRSKKTGAKATFTAGAYADLDCDKTFSTFERIGRVDSRLRVVGGGGLFVDRAEE